MAECIDYRPCPHPVTNTHWVPMNQLLRHANQKHPEVTYTLCFYRDEPVLFNPTLLKWLPMECYYIDYDEQGYDFAGRKITFSWYIFFCKARAKHFVWIKADTGFQEVAELYTAVFKIKRPEGETKCLEIVCPVFTLDTTLEEIMRQTEDIAGIPQKVMKDYFVSKGIGYSDLLGFNWKILISCDVRVKKEKKTN